MVTGIKLERMQQLRARYRSADVLLIDDIQITRNKERTQEEFFHTFNELHDAQKQIVISSDSPPKDIPGLVERLRSRFEWGLMADIQPPDLETKMAILDKKAELDGVKLPEDVRTFMATKTKSNVRELEGALVKLIAYSSLTGTPITMPMAQQVLKHLLHEQDRRITIDSIQKAVAEKFDIKPAQLKEKSNRKEIVRAPPGRDVPGQGADPGLAAGDRPGLRRQAPHDRDPLDPQNRRAQRRTIRTSTR